MTHRWLGRPLQEVEKELGEQRVPYSVVNTCAPRRAPYGDDVRVVQVHEDNGGLTIIACSFSTKTMAE